MDKYGKNFEQKFKEDWKKTIPNSSIDRIYDCTSNYRGVSNISDFICFKSPNIYYIECKTTKDVSFPLKHLTQYKKLKEKVGIEGVKVGVLIWYYSYDYVIYIPVKTIMEIEKTRKSINIKKLLESDLNYCLIPSKKKKTYMDSDYSVLINFKE